MTGRKKQKSDAQMTSGRDASIAESKNAIANELVEQDRAKASRMLFDAKRENIQLQLEAAYREQLVKVYQEVSGEFWLLIISLFNSFHSHSYSLNFCLIILL